MSFAKIFARTLCIGLSSITIQLAHAEPRNCYVEDGEIICQTAAKVDHFLALEPTKKAQVVFREFDDKNGASMGFGGTGYVDGQSTLTATTTKGGRTITREIKMRFLEQENDQDKRLIVINNPKEARGTALLTISNQNGLDDQWSYSPEHKQVKRVARNNSGSSFAGTEIFFEDLSLQSLNKYEFDYLGKETINGRETHLISRVPKDQYSAYSKLHTWIDAENYYPVKVDYFDSKNQLMKTLIASEYKRYNDKYWRAGRMEITNHLNSNETLLVWSDYKFNIGLSEQSFSLNSLKRARNF